MIRRRAAWCVVLLPLALGGCDILGTDEDKEADALRANRLRWSANAHGDDYVLRQSFSCFCGMPLTPHDVSVVATTIADVRDSESGELLPEEQWQYFLTVDGLFAMIEDALVANADVLDVAYHPQLGYPTRITINYSRRTADDEISVTTELLD